jgi:hypothetical protein
VEGVLAFNNSEYVMLNGAGNVRLSIGMRHNIVPNADDIGDRLPWKVHTTSYAYSLHHGDDEPIVDYHWHPHLTADIPFPHLHIESQPRRVHYPTGRVLIEVVLRLAVEWGAEPLEAAKWKKVMKDNRTNFEKCNMGYQSPQLGAACDDAEMIGLSAVDAESCAATFVKSQSWF